MPGHGVLGQDPVEQFPVEDGYHHQWNVLRRAVRACRY